MCDLCGSQPCMCVETECLACKGEGKVVHPAWTAPHNPTAISPPDPVMVTCEDCDGTGQVKCDGPRDGGRCKFSGPPGLGSSSPNVCHCERKWEQQQEDNASEPPPSARERQESAQREREALRSGVAL